MLAGIWTPTTVLLTMASFDSSLAHDRRARNQRLPALAGSACTSPWLACKLTAPIFDNFEARQWTD
jgi:hypothetical protein